MSKTGWIILIVCLIFALCVCAGVFLAGRAFNAIIGRDDESANTTSNYPDLKNAYSQDGTYAIDMKSLQDLTIDWLSGSVTIELTDEDAIRFVETVRGNERIPEQDALRYGVSGRKLRIQACKKNHLDKLPEKDLVVFLPRSLAKDLKTLDLNSISASISGNSLSAREVRVNTISGACMLPYLTAEKVNAYTVSGSLEITYASVDSLHADSVSGSCRVGGVISMLQLGTVSGALHSVSAATETVSCTSVSGPIELVFTSCPDALTADSTSGEVSIALPLNADCQIELETVSGQLLHDGHKVADKRLILGAGSGKFKITTVSGDLNIYSR